MNGEQFLEHVRDVSPVPTVASLLVVFRDMYKLVSCFGTVFSLALSDIETKCNHVETILKTGVLMPEATLTELISFEKQTGKLEKDLYNTGTRQLLPLARSVEFVAQILTRIQTVELCTAIKDSYYVTISKYHSYLVQTGVSTACWTAPYKDVFFAYLSLPDDKDPNQFCQHAAIELMILFERIKEIYANHQCWELK